jgi:hypothetical protein
MKINRLYVDETGVVDGNLGFYIIVGCVIREDKREELEQLSGQIKYKYWNDDSIVFHSQEIGKQIGAFKILKNEEIKKNFEKDLFKLLNSAPIILFPVILDKKEIIKKRWGKKRKLRTVNRNLLRNFIIFTLSTKGSIGKITIEASSLNQDYYYHEALNHYKANGISELDIFGKEVSSVITSLSFVNKSNGDIEEQLADIFAYGVECKLNKCKYEKGSYEDKLLKVLNTKLYRIPKGVKGEKKKMLSEINPLVVIK